MFEEYIVHVYGQFFGGGRVLAIFGPCMAPGGAYMALGGASGHREHPVFIFSSMRATQGRWAGGSAGRGRAHR